MTPTSAPPASPSAPALPALGARSIARVRALWRALAWSALPEALAASPGEAAPPDGGAAALLATLRVLHQAGVADAAAGKLAQARADAAAALAAGPASVLGTAGPDGDAGRLDLAADLLGLDARARVGLEVAVVSALDPGTAQAARVLAGRLGFASSASVALLDELLATNLVGAGRMAAWTARGGALRDAGLLRSDGDVVALTPMCLAFLDGSPPAAVPGAPGDGLPQAGVAAYCEARAGWIDTVAAAVAAGRPTLVSAANGDGLPTLAAAVALRLGVPLTLVDAAVLLRRDADDRAADGGDALGALTALAHLWPTLVALRNIDALGVLLRERPAEVRPWLTALCQLPRPLLLLHEGPVAPELGALCALAGGVPQLDLPPPTPEQRQALLAATLGDAGVAATAAAALAAEVRHYGLGLGQIGAVVATTMQRAGARMGRQRAHGEIEGEVAPPTPTLGELRAGVLAATSARLRAFGSRVETTAGWDDLVLPDEVLEEVRTVARFARLRGKLFGSWGFERKMPYGRALSAMFSGPSGTGKTMVAGLIARDLGVELYRVDLGRLVSKYVGETEQRLGELFDEATQTGAALLFDEADSLFGQRTEIRSANDRYANLEVNYLLQRLEDFDGMVFLTTNFGTSIDEAFLRRIRFRLTFPFPTPAERTRLWQVMLPPELPLDDDGDPADWEWLGDSFELAGGHVRNAVLRAAMLAAEADKAVGMRHLYDAAAAEYRELGKLAPPFPFDEDW